MNIFLNQDLLKKYISINKIFFNKQSKEISNEKLIFINANYNDIFTSVTIMKIGAAISEIFCARMVVLPPLRAKRYIAMLIKSFSPWKILSSRFMIVAGICENILRILKIACKTRTGDSLLKLNEHGISIGIHIYDEILRRERLFTIKYITLKQKLYLIINLGFFFRMRKLFSKNSFSYVVLADNVYRDGIIFEIAKKDRIPTIAGIDVNGIAIHKYETEVDYNYHCRTPDNDLIEKVTNNAKLISDAERYLNARIRGLEAQHDVIRAYDHTKKMINRSYLVENYGLNSNKPIVLVMAHVFSDAPHGYPGMLFKDYYEWLTETLTHLQKNHSIEFLIKEHPSASLYHEEGFIEKILSSLGLLDRLLEKNINTQSLFNSVDVVITCGGTAGQEFPCFGVPVLLGAKPPYAFFNFVISPDTKEEYFREIGKIHLYGKLSQNQMQTAKAVLFTIQHIMKIPKKRIGLGSQEYYLGCDFDSNIFLQEMIDDCLSGKGYKELVKELDNFLKGQYKNLVDYKKITAKETFE